MRSWPEPRRGEPGQGEAPGDAATGNGLPVRRQRRLARAVASSEHVVTQARDTCENLFAFQQAQRLAAGRPRVPVLLAETGDGRRRLARL
jgi:hypothetical protein